MDFKLTEEQQMLKSMVRDFADKVLAPRIKTLPEGETLPADLR